ncbi:MAG: hypothetical protein ABI224_07455 [Acetobacteraceae bacterium]
MARDPLDALLRLRRLAQEDALRELAVCMAADAAANAAVACIDAAIVAEEEAASRLDAEDIAVEAFGRWLRRVREERDAASTARDRAEAGAIRARAVLGAARSALAAVEAELARRAEETRLVVLRREQAAIDEHAGRRPG